MIINDDDDDDDQQQQQQHYCNHHFKSVQFVSLHSAAVMLWLLSRSQVVPKSPPSKPVLAMEQPLTPGKRSSKITSKLLEQGSPLHVRERVTSLCDSI